MPSGGRKRKEDSALLTSDGGMTDFSRTAERHGEADRFVGGEKDRKVSMGKLEEQIKLLEWKDLGDERGNLVVVEGNMDIPFEIKRIFYIYGSDDTVVRGQHANRNSEFVMINVCGTSKVKVDNGKESRIIELNRPRMGLYLKNNIWKDMYDFSPDSILLVLASEHYDEREYIRDYGAYQAYLRELEETGGEEREPEGAGKGWTE